MRPAGPLEGLWVYAKSNGTLLQHFKPSRIQSNFLKTPDCFVEKGLSLDQEGKRGEQLGGRAKGGRREGGRERE